MGRPITHRYVDPLDAVWLGAAERLGLRVERSPHVYASTDGRGTLTIGTGETLDPDDCLAQMIFHELCHALVQGEENQAEPDWGLDNETDRDLPREHACLRVQAHLAGPHGLRQVLAPTTDHRAFYDRLPADPLTPRHDPSVILARQAIQRARRAPWAPHLGRALDATARIVEASTHAGLPEAGDRPPLLDVAERARARHPAGFFLGVDPEATCAGCAWSYHGGRGRPVPRCRQADDARIERGWPACERYEPEPDCQECGACCREAYGAVIVSPRDPVRRAHPDIVEDDDGTLLLRRAGDRCAALAGEVGRFHCRIYADRPRTCRDFERGGEHCLTARRRVGLSL